MMRHPYLPAVLMCIGAGLFLIAGDYLLAILAIIFASVMVLRP
jgi:hypothetical protein